MFLFGGSKTLQKVCHQMPILGIRSLSRGLPDTLNLVFHDGTDTQTHTEIAIL